MNYKIFSILLFLIFSAFQDAQSKSHGKSLFHNFKIVGGENTTIEQHPYQVALMIMEDTYVCGGTILSPYNILTSAQCVSLDYPLTHVRAGSTFWNKGGTLHNVLLTRAHPKFNWHTLDYDVGCIIIEKNIVLDGKIAAAIRLPPSGKIVPIPVGTNVTVIGWGVTKEGNHHASDQLIEITIPTFNDTVCYENYKKEGEYTITPRMFCAGLPHGGKNACHGDNGGPAVDSSTGVQLGIISWGLTKINCIESDFPIAYTNISNPEIRGWIKDNTGF